MQKTKKQREAAVHNILKSRLPTDSSQTFLVCRKIDGVIGNLLRVSDVANHFAPFETYSS